MKANREKIGGINLKRYNYEKDENFFSKADVPEKAREIHDYIQEYINPDNLELRKPVWNPSTFIPGN